MVAKGKMDVCKEARVELPDQPEGSGGGGGPWGEGGINQSGRVRRERRTEVWDPP